eukprot:2157417-Pyramimonas_sp.AAC.1
MCSKICDSGAFLNLTEKVEWSEHLAMALCVYESIDALSYSLYTGKVFLKICDSGAFQSGDLGTKFEELATI